MIVVFTCAAVFKDDGDLDASFVGERADERRRSRGGSSTGSGGESCCAASDGSVLCEIVLAALLSSLCPACRS